MTNKLKNDEFLSQRANNQQVIDFFGCYLLNSVCITYHAKCDADMQQMQHSFRTPL